MFCWGHKQDFYFQQAKTKERTNKSSVFVWMSCFKYSLALHFSVVLGRLSSCDHLDLEKSPSVREVNAAAAGSRYTGRDDSLESFGSKLQLKSNLLFPPFCVSECTDAGLHIYSKPNDMLDPLSFFSFPFSIQVSGISRGLSGGSPTNSSWVLLGHYSLSTWFSPHFLPALLGNRKQNFLSEKTTLLVAHSSHSAAPVGSIPQFEHLIIVSWRIAVILVYFGLCSTKIAFIKRCKWVHYLSVVCNNDQLNVFGRLLSVPFMLP